jgi:alpha-L-fucosidase
MLRTAPTVVALTAVAVLLAFLPGLASAGTTVDSTAALIAAARDGGEGRPLFRNEESRGAAIALNELTHVSDAGPCPHPEGERRPGPAEPLRFGCGVHGEFTVDGWRAAAMRPRIPACAVLPATLLLGTLPSSTLLLGKLHPSALAPSMLGPGTAFAEGVDLAKRAEELKALKWGMFVCWSFSTFSGKEWTPGVKDVSFFKASGCDTDQWARTAKEAAMGYILFLTKHHDGFCLWDTRTTDRKVTRSPLGRDVLAELRKSCDRHGVRLALYFSEGDWTWPGAVDGAGGKGGSNPEMKKAQLRELLTEYGPIEYIWFDHAVGTGGLSHEETVAWCHRCQPGTLVGFNHGDPAGEVRLGEMGRPAPLGDPSGAGFGAANAKGYAGYRVAEFTYPILPPHEGGAMWFYSLPRHDGLCLPASRLYRDYLGAVKCGNIFSIDVGPDHAGKLREIDRKTLRQVGEMVRNPPPEPLSLGKAARASSTWPEPGYEARKAVDGDGTTRWGAARDARSGWLEVDLGNEARIGRVVILEEGYHRTEEFVVEWKDGEAWRELAKGTTIAGDQAIDFPPVTARYVRLNILKASEVPTIEELQVYPPATR